MIKTIDDIKRQKDFLLTQKKGLRDIKIMPLRESSLAGKVDEIADFIDMCWAETYGEQDRFNYNQDYLKWVFGNGGFNSDTSLVAQKSDKVTGLILTAPFKFLYNNLEFDTSIVTALSINPAIKSNGLGRLIYLNVQENSINSLSGIFNWYHSSIQNKFSSHNIHTSQEKNHFDFWGHYHLMSRVFDFQRANECDRLKWYEKLGMIPFSGIKKVSNKEEIEEIDEKNLEEVCDCVNQNTRKNNEGRLFTYDEFKNYAAFTGDKTGFRSKGFVHRNNQGKIDAIGIGYVIETIGKKRDNLFFLDYLLLDTDKKRFIVPFEEAISNNYNVYGLVTLDSRLGLRDGYLPSRTVLSCYSIPFSQDFTKKDNLKRAYPIIEHK
jgi:hypothetical protein